MTTDPFWTTVEQFLTAAADTTTADQLVRSAAKHFPDTTEQRAPDADAFFPGSGGDTQLLDVLADAPAWRLITVHAPYHWTAADAHGTHLTYIEGDLYLHT